VRIRVGLALLCASFALAGAGVWTPTVVAGTLDAQPVVQAAPADVEPGDVRWAEADSLGTAPGVAPPAAALLWTAPDRALLGALPAGCAAAQTLHPRTPLACRGARAPPPRTRS
jgi:hypothetical protein